MVEIRRPPPEIRPLPCFVPFDAGIKFLRLYDTDTTIRYPYSLFRSFGPIERYDHQREKYKREKKPDPERYVCYCAEELSACTVEVFGDKRIITDHYNIVTIEVIKKIVLLDIRGRAAMKAGILAALSAIPDRSCTQAWARYFYLETSLYGKDTGGILYPSAHNGQDCIVLWDRSKASVREIGQIPILDREREIRKIAERNNLICDF